MGKSEIMKRVNYKCCVCNNEENVFYSEYLEGWYCDNCYCNQVDIELEPGEGVDIDDL